MATVEQRETLSMGEVLSLLRQRHPTILENAYVVGRWVWAEFDTVPPKGVRDTLKALGFRWNHKRQVWQNPCGFYSRKSTGDPRWKYGKVPASNVAVDVDTFQTGEDDE